MESDPLVAKAADVKEDARQGSPRADGSGAIEKTARNVAVPIQIVGMLDAIEKPGFFKGCLEAGRYLVHILSAILELTRCRIWFPHEPFVLVSPQDFRGFPPHGRLSETITS